MLTTSSIYNTRSVTALSESVVWLLQNGPSQRDQVGICDCFQMQLLLMDLIGFPSFPRLILRFEQCEISSRMWWPLTSWEKCIPMHLRKG